MNRKECPVDGGSGEISLGLLRGKESQGMAKWSMVVCGCWTLTRGNKRLPLVREAFFSSFGKEKDAKMCGDLNEIDLVIASSELRKPIEWAC